MLREWFGFRQGAVVAAVGMLAVTGMFSGSAYADAPQAGPSVTAQVVKSVKFSCVFPLVGTKEVLADVSITFPDAGKVGEVIQPTDFKVDGKLDEELTSAMNLIGAKTIEATDVSTDVDVKINDTDIGVTLNGLSLPQVPVPASGPTPFTVVGPIPGITPRSAGSISFAIGAKFTAAKTTPKDANGNPTGLGTFSLPCTIVPGQDVTLATIPVT